MEATKLKASLVKKLSKFSWVSYSDRLSIASKLMKTRPTIDNYINGKIGSMEFAEKLLHVLNKLPKPKKNKLIK